MPIYSVWVAADVEILIFNFEKQYIYTVYIFIIILLYFIYNM